MKGIIKEDIKAALYCVVKESVILVIVIISMCFMYNRAIEKCNLLSGTDTVPGVMNYITYLFAGSPKYMVSRNVRFEISYFWLFFTTYLSYILGRYSYDNLRGIGYQYLIRAQKRTTWLVGKMFFVITGVSTYYAITYGTIMMFSWLINGKLSASNEADKFMLFGDKDYNFQALYFMAFICPIVVSIIINICQQCLSLILKPVYSFLLYLGYTAVCGYYMKSYLFLSAMMILRMDIIMKDEGINVIKSIGIGVIGCVAVIICTTIHFKRNDLIELGEE